MYPYKWLFSLRRTSVNQSLDNWASAVYTYICIHLYTHTNICPCVCKYCICIDIRTNLLIIIAILSIVEPCRLFQSGSYSKHFYQRFCSSFWYMVLVHWLLPQFSFCLYKGWLSLSLTDYFCISLSFLLNHPHLQHTHALQPAFFCVLP